MKHARKEAVERRRKDPKFEERVRRIIQEIVSCSSGSRSDGRVLDLTDCLAPYWENSGSSVHGT